MSHYFREVLNASIREQAGKPDMTDILERIQQTLEAILIEVRRTSTVRDGAVSSVLIEDNPTKDRIVRVTSKMYAGSPLPVDEAIEAHGRAHRLAEQHALDGWQETIGALR